MPVQSDSRTNSRLTSALYACLTPRSPRLVIAEFANPARLGRMGVTWPLRLCCLARHQSGGQDRRAIGGLVAAVRVALPTADAAVARSAGRRCDGWHQAAILTVSSACRRGRFTRATSGIDNPTASYRMPR